jgi:hypothetical protein
MPKIEPRLFSFNSPFGACPECNGLGNIMTVDEELVLNPHLTIAEGGILAFANLYDRETWLTRTLKTAFEENDIPMTELIMTLTDEQKKIVLYGTGERVYRVKGRNRFGESTSIYEPYHGVVGYLQARFLETDSELIKKEIQKFMTSKVCDSCLGARLKPEALAVTIVDKSIVDVSDMSIEDCYNFSGKLLDQLSPKETAIATIILKEINARLKFLFDVGLSYLTLSRTADSLAGGEAQRIRLASQIGSGLLVEQLGGRPTPACGFAIGLERVATMIKRDAQGVSKPIQGKKRVYLAQLGEQARRKALHIIEDLRRFGVVISHDLSKASLKTQLELANKIGATHTLIIGQKEVQDGTVIIRDMESGIQEIIDQKKVTSEVKKMLES